MWKFTTEPGASPFFGTPTGLHSIAVVAPTGFNARFSPATGDLPPRICAAPAVLRYTLVNSGTAAWQPTDAFKLVVRRREAGIGGPWALER